MLATAARLEILQVGADVVGLCWLSLAAFHVRRHIIPAMDCNSDASDFKLYAWKGF